VPGKELEALRIQMSVARNKREVIFNN